MALPSAQVLGVSNFFFKHMKRKQTCSDRALLYIICRSNQDRRRHSYLYLISTCSTYNVLLYLRTPCQHLPGSSIEEIQLSRALLPRVAAVNVQGLRLSLPPTRHEVRFSPLKTLPVRVEISSGNFSAHLAWSTLPGSIISVPPGAGCRDVDVGTSIFVASTWS